VTTVFGASLVAEGSDQRDAAVAISAMTLDPLTAVTQLMEPKLGDLGYELSQPSAVIRDGKHGESIDVVDFAKGP
jgi:hypothetical protein